MSKYYQINLEIIRQYNVHCQLFTLIEYSIENKIMG